MISPSWKSTPATPDVAAGPDRLGRGDQIAVAAGVFLNEDGVGAVGQRRAGEDPHGVARTANALKAAPGRGFADDAKRTQSASAARSA